jgi:hypothetical protein
MFSPLTLDPVWANSQGIAPLLPNAMATLPSRGLRQALVAPPHARGLSRGEAARYVGISPAKFDELVRAGLMPGAKRIGARRVWDVRAVDLAFDALPEDTAADANPWDD